MSAITGRNRPADLNRIIEDCRELIAVSVPGAGLRGSELAAPLPSLLEQCRSITHQVDPALEPIRVVSHFACTGGTLMAKCIASMPNTVVLSEVAPYSDLTLRTGDRFFPTDLIQLVRTSGHPVSDELVSELFQSGLKVMHKDISLRGLRLVLRDHAHSKYCVGDEVASSPTLADEVQSNFPALVIVTVRHPLDSFLSLLNNKWTHFEPFTLGEYCRRYLRFLDEHAQYPVFSYEEFTRNPMTLTRQICSDLQLPFNEEFMDLFGLQQMSGDSGRSSNVIGQRPRRPVPADVEAQLHGCESYHVLCERLDYPCD